MAKQHATLKHAHDRENTYWPCSILQDSASLLCSFANNHFHRPRTGTRTCLWHGRTCRGVCCPLALYCGDEHECSSYLTLRASGESNTYESNLQTKIQIETKIMAILPQKKRQPIHRITASLMTCLRMSYAPQLNELHAALSLRAPHLAPPYESDEIILRTPIN